MAKGKGKGTTRPKRQGKRRYIPRRKVCSFCTQKGQIIDYKEPWKLSKYLSDRAKIVPRRKSGNCAKHQRTLATAIKRARFLALLPYTPEHAHKIRVGLRG